MKARIDVEALDGLIDERLERFLLFRTPERPPACVRACCIGPSEQVLKTVAEREGIALQIKEEVGPRGRGQREQAKTGLDVLEELVPVGVRLPSLELEAGLLSNLLERGVAH